MVDLLLLVADKDAQFAVQGGLRRPEALGIRPITYQILSHSQHDAGVRCTGAEILRLKRSAARHAILLLDHEGSGADGPPHELETELDTQIAGSWGDNGKAIVADPEVDSWIWGSDNSLAQILNCTIRPSIRDWLREEGFQFNAQQKPLRPKEAFDALLHRIREPHSAAIYERVTGSISLNSCSDPAFLRLRSQLRHWFPVA